METVSAIKHGKILVQVLLSLEYCVMVELLDLTKAVPFITSHTPGQIVLPHIRTTLQNAGSGKSTDKSVSRSLDGSSKPGEAALRRSHQVDLDYSSFTRADCLLAAEARHLSMWIWVMDPRRSLTVMNRISLVRLTQFSLIAFSRELLMLHISWWTRSG